MINKVYVLLLNLTSKRTVAVMCGVVSNAGRPAFFWITMVSVVVINSKFSVTLM